MMTDYDIQRLSAAIVDRLTRDERFVKRVVKAMPKEEKLLTSRQAAQILGVSRYTVVKNAERLGGIRMGDHDRAHWVFPEEGLIDRYLER